MLVCSLLYLFMLLEIECTLFGFVGEFGRMKCFLLLVNAVALIQVVVTLG